MKLFGQDKEDFTVLVVREADEVAEAVDQALKTAGPEERPGLERAAALLAAARRPPTVSCAGTGRAGRWPRRV